MGNLGSIPGLRRYPGEGKDYPLQDSGLENSMVCIIHGVTDSDTTEQISLSLRALKTALTLWIVCLLGKRTGILLPFPGLPFPGLPFPGLPFPGLPGFSWVAISFSRGSSLPRD